jgi:hypothetical protein
VLGGRSVLGGGSVLGSDLGGGSVLGGGIWAGIAAGRTCAAVAKRLGRAVLP